MLLFNNVTLVLPRSHLTRTTSLEAETESTVPVISPSYLQGRTSWALRLFLPGLLEPWPRGCGARLGSASSSVCSAVWIQGGNGPTFKLSLFRWDLRWILLLLLFPRELCSNACCPDGKAELRVYAGWHRNPTHSTTPLRLRRSDVQQHILFTGSSEALSFEDKTVHLVTLLN